jgi:hypothetical protein
MFLSYINFRSRHFPIPTLQGMSVLKCSGTTKFAFHAQRACRDRTFPGYKHPRCIATSWAYLCNLNLHLLRMHLAKKESHFEGHANPPHFPLLYIFLLGHAVAQLVEALRYKPEGRGFNSRRFHWNFNWHNPSDRIMALGLTQPLTKMSTRNVSCR